MNFDDALRYLDDHTSYDVTGRIDSPTTERIGRLCAAMGDPQHAAPVIHVTGTNGKGSTVQMISRLLMTSGLTVGTYTSPHLERINERIQRNGEPISDEEFAEQIAAIAQLEAITGVRPSFFEAITAAAFRWFADVAVDVMVIEVGLLGRWDATNVVDATVAVITNIGLDHTEFAGPTLADIASEKAGIITEHGAVVVGETDSNLIGVFSQEPHASMLVRDEDFAVVDNTLAVGGRLLDLRTPTTVYSECICLFMAPIKLTMHRQHCAQLRHSLQRHSQMRLFGRALGLSNFRDVSKLWVCNHLSSLMELTILQVQIVRSACISMIFGPRSAESSSWAPFAMLMK